MDFRFDFGCKDCCNFDTLEKREANSRIPGAASGVIIVGCVIVKRMGEERKPDGLVGARKGVLWLAPRPPLQVARISLG